MAIAESDLPNNKKHNKGISDETLAAIRKLDIKQFAEELGDVLHKSGKWYMTYRNGGERTPSVGIQPENNYWEDFTRPDTFGKDVLSYYAYREYDDKHLKGEKFVEAVKFVCHLAGIPILYNDGTVEQPTGNRKIGEAQQMSDIDRELEAKADDGTLDFFYRNWLDVLPLLDMHYKHLLEERGLSEREIKARAYRSVMDNKRMRYVSTKHLIAQCRRSPDGVPGFIQANGEYGPYWTFVGRNGFLIPFRNLNNQIVGLQLRVDDPYKIAAFGKIKINLNKGFVEARNADTGHEIWKGKRDELPKEFPEGKILLEPSSKYLWVSSSRDPARGILKGARIGFPTPAPYHTAVPSKILKVWEPGTSLMDYMDTSIVWWGEGPLKGDICSEYTENVHLQIAGIKNYELLIEPTLALKPREVIIAFDADAQSKDQDVGESVIRCIERARSELQPLGIKLTLAAWREDQAKGLDDLMAGRGLKPLFYDL